MPKFTLLSCENTVFHNDELRLLVGMPIDNGDQTRRRCIKIELSIAKSL